MTKQKIEKYIKKNEWFRMGKWKESVLMQDSLFRGITRAQNDIILHRGPQIYVMFDFKQYSLLSDFQAHVKEAKIKLLRNPQKISRAISDEVRKAVTKIEKFVPDNMSASSLARLLDLLGTFGWQSYRFMIMGYSLQELYLESLPSSFRIGNESFTPQTLLAQTALPKKLFPMIEERYSLLRLASFYKKGRNVNTEVGRHAKTYGWMNSLCWWDEPFNSKHYFSEIKRLARGNPLKKLQQMQASRAAQYREAARLLRLVRAAFPTAWNFIDVIRDMTDGREESWDGAAIAGQRLRPWFKKTAADLGLTYDQFMALSVDEMVAGVASGQNVATRELTLRVQHPGVAVSDSGKSYIFSGRDTQKIAAMLEPDTRRATSAKGMPVWLGKIRGRACVITSFDDLGKMKSGSILICPMTDPDFMPAIRKAKALVTDQGGVLCHAAIVARELQKTCIVGTQIATKIFKTGDIIEVDTNRGIVKLVKRG